MTSLSSHLSHNAGGVFAVIDAWSALDYKLTELATRMSAHHERVSNWYRLIYERPNPPGCRVSVKVDVATPHPLQPGCGPTLPTPEHFGDRGPWLPRGRNRRLHR